MIWSVEPADAGWFTYGDTYSQGLNNLIIEDETKLPVYICVTLESGRTVKRYFTGTNGDYNYY
jgi:hypothetical protein